MNLFERRRGLIKSAVGGLVKLIVTAANGIVSFVTNVAMPTKITCEFSPVQAGTGDPSPSNVRSISGWTGCNIHHGKNLLDISQKRDGYYLDGNGVEQANVQFGYTLAFTPVISGKTYTLSGNLGNSGSAYAGFYLYNADKTFVGRSTFFSNLLPYTYTIPSNVSYVRVQYFKNISNAQLEEGSTATTFEEYTANTLPVNWTNDAGTVYGGTLTINEDGSGTLVSKYKLITLSGSNSWMGGGDGAEASVYRLYTSIGSQSDASAGYSANCFSDKFKPIGRNGPNNMLAWECMYGYGTQLHISVDKETVGITSDMTIVQMRTAVNTWLQSNNATFAIPMAEPVATYNLTASQVNSLIGTNNIWHDMNGSITVEYYNKQ